MSIWFIPLIADEQMGVAVHSSLLVANGCNFVPPLGRNSDVESIVKCLRRGVVGSNDTTNHRIANELWALRNSLHRNDVVVCQAEDDKFLIGKVTGGYLVKLGFHVRKIKWVAKSADLRAIVSGGEQWNARSGLTRLDTIDYYRIFEHIGELNRRPPRSHFWPAVLRKPIVAFGCVSIPIVALFAAIVLEKPNLSDASVEIVGGENQKVSMKVGSMKVEDMVDSLWKNKWIRKAIAERVISDEGLIAPKGSPDAKLIGSLLENGTIRLALTTELENRKEVVSITSVSARYQDLFSMIFKSEYKEAAKWSLRDYGLYNLRDPSLV